ncbi:MAG TPA: metallophosphoesterase family protein [Bacteroidales bacterium]|nr:metallophosphoesterase family protein [Bacteroidales bacterium]
MKIGLISDTHGFIDEKIIAFLSECKEIWHAGDIGNLTVIEQLERIATVRAVFGNIDGTEIRQKFKEKECFNVEDVNVLMMHIGGYPGNYSKEAYHEIRSVSPKLFISGHSHILKVIFDKRNHLLHINPGAAGKNGFHMVRTAIRFKIESSEIKDLEVLELPRR